MGVNGMGMDFSPRIWSLLWCNGDISVPNMLNFAYKYMCMMMACTVYNMNVMWFLSTTCKMKYGLHMQADAYITL